MFVTLILAFTVAVTGYKGHTQKDSSGDRELERELKCARDCDHMCIESSFGPMCACREGFRLYDDMRTCVLTEELLEEAEEEMAENIALPIAIVLVVGFLVILCMAIVTWYCVTRDSTSVVAVPIKDTQSYRSNSSTLPINIRSYNKPLHISIV